MTTSRAGNVGIASVLFLLAWQTLEEWSLFSAVDAELKRLGSLGSVLLALLHSRLLVLALAVAAIILIRRAGAQALASSPVVEGIENRAEASTSQTQTLSPHIEQHVHLADTPKPEQQPEAPALLEFVQVRPVRLHEAAFGVWHEASDNLEQAHPGMVMKFRNRPGQPGEHAARADVSARLIFTSPGVDDLHINGGAWLGRFENVVRFGAGDSHELLIAIKLVPWVTLDNPHKYNLLKGRRRSGISIHPPRQFSLAPKGDMEITLVDLYGTTLYAGEFTYTSDGAEMRVERT